MIRSIVLSATLLIVLTGCAAIDSVETTPEPAVTDVPPTPAPSPSPSPTPAPNPTPSPTPTPEPTPEPTATPTPEPSPTPTPRPSPRTVTESACCGLFDWVDGERLLVFDETPDAGEGSWIVDVGSGDRSRVAAGYGIPSDASTVAFPEPDQGQVVLRDLSGEEVGRIDNGGRISWPSPDGSRVAWFENLPIRTPSSSVNRSVELFVGEFADGSRRKLLELQAAEVHWLPDNRHLLIPARNLAFEQAGLWLVDSETGDYEVLYEELFIQAVRLSPGGGQVAFMRTFNDDPAQNGVWVLDIESGELNPAGRSGPYRWAGDNESLWFLEMTGTGSGADRLVRVDLETNQVVEEVELDGQVENAAWEISPAGDYVAYWRLSDGQVVVQPLPAGQ